MQVFRLFFKIIKDKKLSIFINVGIFLAVCLFVSFLTHTEKDDQFTDVSLDIAVVDKDHSPLSIAITDYLEQRHNLKNVKGTKEGLQDSLYFQETEYILLIPQGFADSFAHEGESKLETLKAPGTSTGYLLDSQIEDFLQNVHLGLVGGSSLNEAAKQALSLADLDTPTGFLGGDRLVSQDSRPGIYYYLRYLPYALLACLTSALCPIFVVLYQADVRKRNTCSALTLRSFNRQLGLGCICFTTALLAFLLLSGLMIYRKELALIEHPFWLLLNTAACTLTAMSLGFFAGFIAKNDVAVSGLSNVISLSLCFLGGIFVDTSLLSKQVAAFSQVLPTYWYTRVNDMLFRGIPLERQQYTLLAQGLGLQLAFALAVFAVALAISRRRRDSSF